MWKTWGRLVIWRTVAHRPVQEVVCKEVMGEVEQKHFECFESEDGWLGVWRSALGGLGRDHGDVHLDVKLGFLVKVRHWSSRMLFGYPMIVVIVLLLFC